MTEKELNTPTSVNQLINVSETIINGETVNSIDARELHLFLEVSTRFDQWLSRRIEEYEFIEDIDFRSFMVKSSGGRPSVEYTISIDMAKELSMVERNEKGKEARKYFIQCEKIAKGLEKVPRLNQNEIQCNMIALKYTVEMLKPSPASLIEMTKILYTDLGLKTNLLPNYAENVKIVLSATELLKRKIGRAHV